jgi:hypothetical protein
MHTEIKSLHINPSQNLSHTPFCYYLGKPHIKYRENTDVFAIV